MFNLRVKCNMCATIPFQGKVNGESSLWKLKQELYTVTSIPIHKQKILIGYPPKPIIGRSEDKLKTLGLKNGEVIIVEEISSSSEYDIETGDSHRHNVEEIRSLESVIPHGLLIKKVVPSDNSCLFTSIYFLVNGGDVNENNLHTMREIVAQAIAQQPQIYNEALLEKSNEEYCNWILKETSWGGAIELSVFSDYYQIEIVALDAKSGLINRFGEDKRYMQRIFLMYDGIHYDPLYLKTYDGRNLYILLCSEEWILDQAYAMVQEAKSAGHFTDTNKFCLLCNDCGIKMHGEQEAVRHARDTGHSNFDEVQRNI